MPPLHKPVSTLLVAYKLFTKTINKINATPHSNQQREQNGLDSGYTQQ